MVKVRDVNAMWYTSYLASWSESCCECVRPIRSVSRLYPPHLTENQLNDLSTTFLFFEFLFFSVCWSCDAMKSSFTFLHCVMWLHSSNFNCDLQFSKFSIFPLFFILLSCVGFSSNAITLCNTDWWVKGSTTAYQQGCWHQPCRQCKYWHVFLMS